MTDDVVGLSNSPSGFMDPDTSFHVAPLAYLRSLHRGFTLILVAMAASIVCWLLYVPGLVILMSFGSEAKSSAVPVVMVVFMITMLGISVVSWTAKYFYTVPDPRGARGEDFENYRRVLRVFLWVGIVVAIASIIFLLMNLSWQPLQAGESPFGLSRVAQMGVNIVAAALGLAQFIFLMLYFEQIGLRLHDPWIAARAKKMVWLLPVLCLLACTIVAPVVGIVMLVQLYVRVWKGLGRVIAERAAAPVV